MRWGDERLTEAAFHWLVAVVGGEMLALVIVWFAGMVAAVLVTYAIAAATIGERHL